MIGVRGATVRAAGYVSVTVLAVGLIAGCTGGNEGGTAGASGTAVATAGESAEVSADGAGSASPDGAGTASSEAATGDAGAALPPLGSGEVDVQPSNGSGTVDDVLELSVTTVEATEGTATMAGEISGPALLVTLTASNTGTTAIDVSGLTVNAYAGPDSAPALVYANDDRQLPFSGEVQPGASVAGVYLFGLPSGYDTLTVAVLGSDGKATVAFADVTAV